ncbi:hypothetical protein OQZ55_14895 [Bacillus subtilis]|uniref:hypothetical protein n=1 Tax=Bacillus subtilis TaxID=1423 RepID=UPI001E3074AC|nr:hypothetical protein [Bacillus subtilis]MCX4077482.1 hypothetical protein [Bacillus subtilis]MEC0432675.1 hypothetical protein [Bacillus subtilis]
MKKLFITVIFLCILTGCSHSMSHKIEEENKPKTNAFIDNFVTNYNEYIEILNENDQMPPVPEKINVDADIRKEESKNDYYQIIAAETETSDSGFLYYQLRINYDVNKEFKGFHLTVFGAGGEIPVKSIGCAVVLLKSLDLDSDRAAAFFDENKLDDEWNENGYRIKFSKIALAETVELSIIKE